MANDYRDFFISYTHDDKSWAEWIAWQLHREGYSTLIQAWDIRPGSNFILEMDRATKIAKRIIAVLSTAYLQALYPQSEWAAAFRKDPTGQYGTLLPVRIQACKIDGLLAPIGYIDLVGLDEETARKKLLQGISRDRALPKHAPPFPGHP